jgi:protein SCO1/2
MNYLQSLQIAPLKHFFRELALSACVILVGSHCLAEDPPSLYDLELSWQDQTGQSLSISEWKGSPVILTMAYTRCKSACPITIQRLKTIESGLEKENKRAEFVIVSFDPSRDTSAQLSHFIRMHDLKGRHWHLLTGSEEAVRKLAVALGISYQEDPKTQEFTHSNKIILLDKKGRIAQEVEGLGSNTAPIVSAVGR